MEPSMEGSPTGCGGPEDVESAGILSQVNVGTAAVCVCPRRVSLCCLQWPLAF